MAKELPETSSLSPLSKRKEEAAQLVAAGRLSCERIAETVGVTKRQLYTWRQQPDFIARIDVINEAFAAEVERYAIAQRARRVAALDDRHRRLARVIEARATALTDDPLHDPLCLGTFRSAALASGFDTGMVTLEWATTPRGGFKPQFKVDTGLSAEMRNLEKQAAQERGEWVDKVAPTTPDGTEAYRPPNLSGLSDEELEIFGRIRAKLDGDDATDAG